MVLIPVDSRPDYVMASSELELMTTSEAETVGYNSTILGQSINLPLCTGLSNISYVAGSESQMGSGETESESEAVEHSE